MSGDPSGEAPYAQQLLKGLGTGGELWSGVMTQHCDGVAAGAQSCPSSNNEHVPYPTGGALTGVWVDESAPSPAAATGHQLGVEAVNAAAHFGNTTAAANRDAQYVITSPTGTNRLPRLRDRRQVRMGHAGHARRRVQPDHVHRHVRHADHLGQRWRSRLGRV